MDQGSLYFSAGINMSKWKQDVANIQNDIRGIRQTSEQQATLMDNSFKRIGQGLAGAFSVAAISGFVREVINVRGEFQKTEIAFGTMLKSQSAAAELMEQMVDLAAKTPFSLEEVSSGAKQLLAFQVPANEVVDTLTRMGNIAAGLGVPLSRINLVYGQVKAKGRLMGDDLRQFTESGIPMVAELARKFNKTTAEISDMVSAGKIGFKDVQDVLFSLTNEGGMFFNLMEKQSASLSGKVSNLGDAWDQMLNKIGQSTEGVLGDSIDGLAYLVDNYESVAEILGVVIATYGIHKAALIANSAAQKINNATVLSEISALGISDKMRLGRAVVTERQTAALLNEAKAEQASLAAKYATLQAEVSLLAVKKQKITTLAAEKTAAAQSAAVQLSLAKMELQSLSANATAKQRNIATKNVERVQNEVLALQEQASIQRKNALSVSTQFYTAKKELENTATKVSIAGKRVETTQEAALAASKNVTAIASARLTVAQKIAAFATTNLTKATKLLYTTLAANPFTVVMALLAGLAYAIYKNVTATTAYERLQNKLIESTDQHSESIIEQKTKIDTLVATIKNKKTSDEQAASALKQLNSITGDRIQGLTVEGIRIGENTAAIANYIQMLEKEAKAKAIMDALVEAEKEERRIRKTSYKDLSWEDRIGNFSDAKSFTQNPYERKRAALIRDLKGVWKTKEDLKRDLIKMQQQGIKVTSEMTETQANTAILSWKKNLEERIKNLDVQIDSAPTAAIAAKLSAQKRALEKQLNDVLSPKDKEKHARDLAEVFSRGSIADLEQRISLWNEALQKASGDNVFELTKDKYGDTKKTGKTFTVAEALQEVEALEKMKAERLKVIQKKSFQEQIAEIKRQIQVRDNLLKNGYSKDQVDSMFPEIKDKSFINYLTETSAALSKVDTAQAAEDLLHLQQVLSDYRQDETFIDNVNKQLERLKKQFSGGELIERLERLNKSNLKIDGGGGLTEDEIVARDAIINKAIDAELERQRERFEELLKEQKTYEEKSLALQKEFEDMKASAQYQAASDADRAKIDKSFSVQQGLLDIDMIKKSKEWEVAFGELEGMTNTTLQAVLNKLLEFKEKSKGTLSLQDSAELEKAIEKVRQAANRNPFTGLTQAGQEYFQTQKVLTAAQKEYNAAVQQFGVNSTQAIAAQNKMIDADQKALIAKQKLIGQIGKGQEVFNAVGQGLLDLGDMFGGFDDATTDAINNIMAIGNAAMDLGTAISKGDIAGVIKAGIQLISSVWKAINGDQKKERQIKKQAAQLKLLERVYNDLAYAAEKAYGAQKYKGQQDMIKNLEQQRAMLQSLAATEGEKKRADQGKIDEYNAQIQSINQSIENIKEGIIKEVLQTDIPDMASKIGDALLDAFAKGEDGIDAINGAFDNMVKNMLRNQLNKILEKDLAKVVDSMRAAMGFNADGTGTFNGLTPEEIADLRAQVQAATSQGQAFIDAYSSIFEDLGNPAEGLKGDIKGMTEKTAGALEGQINAMRINQIVSQDIMRNSLLQLTQIEINTRNLVSIRQDISEMNGKMQKGLAGIP